MNNVLWDNPKIIMYAHDNQLRHREDVTIMFMDSRVLNLDVAGLKSNVETLLSRMDDIVNHLWFMRKSEIEITLDPDNDVIVFLKGRLMETQMLFEENEKNGFLYDYNLSRQLDNAHIFYLSERWYKRLLDLIRKNADVDTCELIEHVEIDEPNHISIFTTINGNDVRFIVTGIIIIMDEFPHYLLPYAISNIHQDYYNQVIIHDKTAKGDEGDLATLLLTLLY